MEAFVAVLTSLLLLAADLSTDGETSLTLTNRGLIREVAVRLDTDCLSGACREEGADGLYLLPEAFHSRVRFISALCVLTHMDLSVKTEELPGGIRSAKAGTGTRSGAKPGTKPGARPIRTLSVSLLIGGEPPPILDFKYSAPEQSVPAVVLEMAALFPPSAAPGEQDDP